MKSDTPTVSIILPTYNRAKFLPQAFASIRSQTFADWELIVVDDGSTDDTAELVRELAEGMPQPMRYVRQPNGGPYAARNTGLDAARGEYVAFFDSDDVWLPHHLADCVGAMEAHPEVDWVFGSCRMIDLTTGRELAPDTFRVEGKPRPFTRLKGKREGRLFVIDDPDAARCQILHGLYCGLQNSVIRGRVFDGYRFRTHRRNEAEDQVVVIRSLAAGFRFAYFDNVHVLYHVHGDNSSGAAVGASLDRRLRVQNAVVGGFEDMRREVRLTRAERRALNRRLGSELFWTIGYALLWQNGRREEALKAFRKGLREWPWDWRCWKTYAAAVVRTRFAAGFLFRTNPHATAD